MTLSRRWVALFAILTALCATGAVALVSTARAAACQVAAAGDIAETGGAQQRTGDQIRALAPQAVLTLGDNVYENGTLAEYNTWYQPAWGSFKAITHPAPGNHEYQTAGAAGYFAYFGLAPATQSYYAFDVCGWRLYSLNSELTASTSPTRAAMLSWFAADAAAHADQPSIAYWHKPRWSDGTGHGDDPLQQDLFAAAATAHVRIVLNGHDHVYERYTEMNAAGAASSGGTREFIVGTGGAGLGAFDASPATTSQKRITGSHGAMLLTLRPNGFDWKFADWDGSTTDTGTTTWAVATSTSSTTSSTTSVPPSTTTSPPASTTPCPPTAGTVTVTASVTVTATVTKSVGFAPPTTVTPVVVAPAVTVTPTVIAEG
jgi:hypothetical protein